MTKKLVVIINSLKIPKINKILLYELQFPVPNYSCLQNPWLGATAPRSPFSLSSTEFVEHSPPEQNFLVRHWFWKSLPAFCVLPTALLHLSLLSSDIPNKILRCCFTMFDSNTKYHILKTLKQLHVTAILFKKLQITHFTLWTEFVWLLYASWTFWPTDMFANSTHKHTPHLCWLTNSTQFLENLQSNSI
jgi:hypothetical protein